MPVVVQQDVVAIGVRRTVHAGYFLNYGVQEATDQVHVHVTGAIITKAQEAVIMHQK